MPLSRQDSLRLLRFCLGPDDSGSVEVADDGAALVTIAPAEPSIGVRTFEASTFDAALRMAVDAGLLKAACVEKQILFLEGGASRNADAPVAAAPRRFRPDLFPKLMVATSALLHETQNERGMSAICRRVGGGACSGASCRGSANARTRGASASFRSGGRSVTRSERR